MKYVEVYKNRPITPIFDFRFGIRDNFIWKAKKSNKSLRIYTTKGIAIVTPEWLLKNTLYTKPFIGLHPDRPMTLHYVDLPLNIKQPDIVEERNREIKFERQQLLI